MTKLLFVSLGWVGFCVVHSAMLYPPVKQFIRLALRINNQSYRLLYAFISVVTLFISVFIMLLADGYFLKKPDVFTYTMGGMLIAGSLYLMKLSFANYSLTVFLGLQAEKEPQLNFEGLNRYVRHPLYLGTILFLIGLMVFWPTDVFITSGLILIAYTILGSKLEEQKLILTFGKAYTDYMVEVPAFLPKIFEK